MKQIRHANLLRKPLAHLTLGLCLALGLAAFAAPPAHAAASTPVVEDNKVYGNGTPLLILEEDGTTAVYADTAPLGEKNGGDTLITQYTGEYLYVYGGSKEGELTADPCITMLGGKVWRIFGGNAAGTLRGSTTVTVLGGTITEEVYGGNYSGTVTGGTTVTIGAEGAADGPTICYAYGGGELKSSGHTNVVSGTVTLTMHSGSVKYLAGGGRYCHTGAVALNLHGGTVTNRLILGPAYGSTENPGSTGKVTFTMTGGTVTGTIYTHGSDTDHAPAIKGDVSIRITGGTVTNNLYLGHTYGSPTISGNADIFIGSEVTLGSNPLITIQKGCTIDGTVSTVVLGTAALNEEDHSTLFYRNADGNYVVNGEITLPAGTVLPMEAGDTIVYHEGASLSGLAGVSIGGKAYAFGGDARYGVLLKADTADTYWQAGSGGVLYNKADATLTLTNAEVGTLGIKASDSYTYAGLLLNTGSPLTLKLAGSSTVANDQLNAAGSRKWGLHSSSSLTIENAAADTEGSLTVSTYPNAGADYNNQKAALYLNSGNLTINSGSVTATATTDYCYGVQLFKGDLTMNGGSLTATGKTAHGVSLWGTGNSIQLAGSGASLTAESNTDSAVYTGGEITLTGNGATLSATSGGSANAIRGSLNITGDGYWWTSGSVFNEAYANKSRTRPYNSNSYSLTLRNHVHSYAADAAQNLAYDTEAHWQACENPNCPGEFSGLPLYGAHTLQSGASKCESCAFQPINSVTAAVENSSQTAIELVYGYAAAPTLAVTVDPADLTGAAYQWYTVTDSGTENELSFPIQDATKATYTPSPGLEVGSYIYRCRVTAHGAYMDSKDVALTVKQAQTSLTGSLPAANPVYGSSIETAATFANTGLAATGAVTLPAAVDASLGENQTGTFLLQNGGYTLLGTAQTVTNGAVGFAIDTTQLGAGTHPLEIYYKGTANLSHAVYRFDLTVEPRPVTVTAHDQTITYGTPPALGSEGYTIAAPTAATGLLGGHSLTATLVPSTDQVTENGQLQLSEVVITDGIGRVVTANYAVDALPGRLIIQRRLVTILPDAGQNKPYDGTDSTPALGYTLSGLAGSETLSGSIDREAGTAAGQYAYTPGTFTEANHPNYTFAMAQNADKFTITPLDLGTASTEITLGNRPVYSGSPLVQTVAAVTANGLTLAPGDYTTTGDSATKVGVYQLTVTGQGNFAGSASVLWQVYPNTGSISGVTEQNVTAENAEAITALKQSAADAIAAAAGDPNTLATPQDIAQWTVVVNGCDALLQQIEDAQQAAETEHITGTAAVTDQNVALADKADLQAAQTDLQAALNDYAGNYTDTQRAEVQADLDRVTGALNSIAAVETLTDKVTALPAAADILPDTEPAISNVAAAWNAYTALTSHEKSLLSTDTVTALQTAYAAMTDYRMVKAQHENSIAELPLNDAHWTRGMANGLVFVANGAAHKLAAVLVDGVVVDPAGYTVRSGSTIVTLQPDHLHTLALGGHTVTFRYPDGEVSARFTVYESPALSATSPKTGPGVSLWPMTAALGGAAIALAALRRKAKHS